MSSPFEQPGHRQNSVIAHAREILEFLENEPSGKFKTQFIKSQLTDAIGNQDSSKIFEILKELDGLMSQLGCDWIEKILAILPRKRD